MPEPDPKQEIRALEDRLEDMQRSRAEAEVREETLEAKEKRLLDRFDEIEREIGSREAANPRDRRLSSLRRQLRHLESDLRMVTSDLTGAERSVEGFKEDEWKLGRRIASLREGERLSPEELEELWRKHQEEQKLEQKSRWAREALDAERERQERLGRRRERLGEARRDEIELPELRPAADAERLDEPGEERSEEPEEQLREDAAPSGEAGPPEGERPPRRKQKDGPSPGAVDH